MPTADRARRFSMLLLRRLYFAAAIAAVVFLILTLW
jgi:hypothetical protein